MAYFFVSSADKEEDQIEQFFELLEQEFNQKPIVDWIKQTVEKCQAEEEKIWI